LAQKIYCRGICTADCSWRGSGRVGGNILEKFKNPCMVCSKRGHVRINAHSRQVHVRRKGNGRAGEDFDVIGSLTPKEFDLLQVMVSRQNYVLTRDSLLVTVWGGAEKSFPRTVDKHIETLRSKMGNAAQYIVTVSGVGYKFSEEDGV
jgi:DNA-binding response OmpR family regulator